MTLTCNLQMACQEGDLENKELSAAQKQRTEDNRLKALALKKSRVRQNPYQGGLEKSSARESGKDTQHIDLLRDSRGGFMLMRNDTEDQAISTRSQVVQDDRKLV